MSVWTCGCFDVRVLIEDKKHCHQLRGCKICILNKKALMTHLLALIFLKFDQINIRIEIDLTCALDRPRARADWAPAR